MIKEEESVMTYNQFEKNFAYYQHPDFQSSFVDPEKRIFIIDPTAKVTVLYLTSGRIFYIVIKSPDINSS